MVRGLADRCIHVNDHGRSRGLAIPVRGGSRIGRGRHRCQGLRPRLHCMRFGGREPGQMIGECRISAAGAPELRAGARVELTVDRVVRRALDGLAGCEAEGLGAGSPPAAGWFAGLGSVDVVPAVGALGGGVLGFPESARSSCASERGTRCGPGSRRGAPRSGGDRRARACPPGSRSPARPPAGTRCRGAAAAPGTSSRPPGPGLDDLAEAARARVRQHWLVALGDLRHAAHLLAAEVLDLAGRHGMRWRSARSSTAEAAAALPLPGDRPLGQRSRGRPCTAGPRHHGLPLHDVAGGIPGVVGQRAGCCGVRHDQAVPGPPGRAGDSWPASRLVVPRC